MYTVPIVSIRVAWIAGWSESSRLDPFGALVQNLARRDRVPERLARVGHLEQVDHEPRGLPCRFGLGLGSHALPFRLVAGEPGRACQGRGDAHAGDRGGDQPHHASVAPMGLALLEFVEPDAEHAGDQLQLAVELAVLARPDIGRNRFRGLFGQLTVVTHPQDKRRREAFIVCSSRIGGRTRLAVDDEREDPVRLA